MSVKNKCRARWTNQNGTHWHSCSLPGDHKGAHTCPSGYQPAEMDIVVAFNAWGVKGVTLEGEDKFGGRER